MYIYRWPEYRYTNIPIYNARTRSKEAKELVAAKKIIFRRFVYINITYMGGRKIAATFISVY